MARHRIDPDSEFDATACAQRLLQSPSEPSPAPEEPWTPPEPAPRRQKRSRGRQYGPDSIPGLADYFTRACPPLSWAGGLEIGNRRALMAIFSELRRNADLTPEDCRALVDLYITRLAGRPPSKPYVWDFKFQRFELIQALRSRGVGVTDAEYEGWRQAASTPADESAAFIASWENS